MEFERVAKLPLRLSASRALRRVFERVVGTCIAAGLVGGEAFSIDASLSALANTEAFQVSRRERKKVEVRFARMKRIHRLEQLRLRGLSGAKEEVLLTATAQNQRRLAKLIWRPPQPIVGVPVA